MTSLSDIYWVAGYLEGEGYFGYGKANGHRSKSLTFKISVGSTDRDVVEKASRILSGIVRLHSNGNGIRNGYAKKQVYDFTIHGSKAIQWMMTIYPLMSIRRKARIKETILAWKSYTSSRDVTKVMKKSSQVIEEEKKKREKENVT